MNYKEQLTKVLKEITAIDDVCVEFATDERFGDYSSNVALKNKELDIDEIIEKLNKDNNNFTAEKKGGFINFWLKKDILIDSLIEIDEEKEGNGKVVIVDYSSPNIAKPFGIGHLRSTVIGQALYNLYKYLGYKVIGDNHSGDWGTQFGKLLYMIDKTKTKDLSIENLEKLYVSFHKEAEKDVKLEEEARKWFKKLEDNDTTARTIWKQCVKISLNEFDKIYDLLGVKIDNNFGESFYLAEMKEMLANPAIIKHLETGENNSKIIKLPNIKTPLMFLKSDGATTYATRDMATLSFRQKKYKPDLIIYEVGAEQQLYFKQLFLAAKLLKIVDQKTELVHTAHGLYLASDGKKFSTRKGKTIKLEQVLEEAIERAKKLGNSDQAIATQVGIGAIKYFDLMHSVQSDVVFDWEKIMNMEGNSGPYIQYTVARINSVTLKGQTLKDQTFTDELSFEGLTLSEQETSVLRKLSQFQEIIVIAAKNYSPNVLCSYLYELASKFNSLYNAHKIIGSETEEFRLLLTKKTGETLKKGLKILGIETPERM
ncbi:MAG: arginine--tRNA ligase [Patescibacteria group bacterium]